jgi:predicted TPR repeat methyltransferase
MTSTRNQTHGSTFLQRAYGLTTPEEQAALYDEWAAQYDDELLSTQGYVAPTFAANALLLATGDKPGRVLDAGCGTGLVGKQLAGRGELHGVDLSPGMLQRAQSTGAYTTLKTMDLTRDLAFQDREFDAVTCVGTLTHGHVGPGALAELVRVTRSGGVVVATVLEDMWEADGFSAQVAKLAAEGRCKVDSKDVVPYRQAAGVSSLMLVLRVL